MAAFPIRSAGIPASVLIMLAFPRRIKQIFAYRRRTIALVGGRSDLFVLSAAEVYIL